MVGARNFSPHHHVQTGSGDKAAGVWSWPLISI